MYGAERIFVKPNNQARKNKQRKAAGFSTVEGWAKRSVPTCSLSKRLVWSPQMTQQGNGGPLNFNSTT
jgi:uncharacterized membrane-anchored protein